jgi:hypothetical protein
MARAVVLLLAGALMGLTLSVQPRSGTTAHEEQRAIQMCKDQAHAGVVSAGEQTKEFLLSLTILGEPAALESNKSKQAEVLKHCLEARGYVTKQVPEGAVDTTSAPDPPAAAAPPVPGIDSLSVEWPPGFDSKPLSDRQRRHNVAAWAVDRSDDITVVLIADRHAGVSDVPTDAASMRAAMLRLLPDASVADIVRSRIGGRPAYRIDGGGIRNGIQVKILETVIEGTEQIIIVDAWTPAANWPNKADLMRGLPAKVTGIR